MQDVSSSTSQHYAEPNRLVNGVGQTLLQPHLDEMEKRIMERVDERLQDIQSRMNAKLDLILDQLKAQNQE